MSGVRGGGGAGRLNKPISAPKMFSAIAGCAMPPMIGAARTSAAAARRACREIRQREIADVEIMFAVLTAETGGCVKAFIAPTNSCGDWFQPERWSVETGGCATAHQSRVGLRRDSVDVGRRAAARLDGVAMLRVGQDHDLGADADAAVEIDYVVIGHADAATRHALADGGRIVGAVNAV